MGGRQTKKVLIEGFHRELNEVVRVHEEALSSMRKTAEMTAQMHAKELAYERQQTFIEQQTRIAAQKGLVPYVRALEAFDHWLLERPDLRDTLQPILQELGLWEIKLGYDPEKDLGLSVISAQRK